MQTKVGHLLEEVCGLKPSDKLLVGVSGGPDSICLLHLLSKSFNFQIVVAHLDHQLRPESAAEADTVRSLAEGYGLPFVIGVEDTLAYAHHHHLSLEEAGRELRYQFLFQQAELRNAQAVLVGHHADDQVETVLMHLLRGAGLAGLGGMPSHGISHWHPEIPLLRPLLSISKQDIIQYCTQHQLKTIEDTSNQDAAFFRNRLRHQLIPYLEGFNPQIRSLILQMADTLRADYQTLSALTEEVFTGCLIDSSSQHIALDREAFSAQKLGVRRSLIRYVVGLLRPGLRDFGFQDVNRALSFLKHPPQSGQADLAAGLRLQIETDRLIIADWKAELLRADWPQWVGGSQPLKIPGSTALENNWQVAAELLTNSPTAFQAAYNNPDPFTAYFELDPQVSLLKISHRQPGDRISPLGMDQGSLKIGDLMTNAKLPQAARSNWPLVSIDGEIVWVPGIRRSGLYLVQAGEKSIVKIAFERKADHGT
jgi:tRNA(Ile)-lysidine synthase